jgi:diguanylate cyclase (GGDEF)-like protein
VDKYLFEEKFLELKLKFLSFSSLIIASYLFLSGILAFDSGNLLEFKLKVGIAVVLLLNLFGINSAKKEKIPIFTFLLSISIFGIFLVAQGQNIVEATLSIVLFPVISLMVGDLKHYAVINLAYMFIVIFVILKSKNSLSANDNSSFSIGDLVSLTVYYFILSSAGYHLLTLFRRTAMEAFSLSVKDPLTNLFNRSFAVSFLSKCLERLKRNLERNVCVVYIDLDNFKSVNDNYGHSEGDAVLEQVAEIIKRHFRKTDVVSRWGGDEFLIIATNIDCTRLRRRLEATKVEIERKFANYKLSMSYGISQSPKDGEDLEELLRKADRRMYKRKLAKNGKLQKKSATSAVSD